MKYIIYILILLFLIIIYRFFINYYVKSKYDIYNLSKKANGTIINFDFDINLPLYRAHNTSIIKNNNGYILYTRYSTYNCNSLSLISKQLEKINNYKYYTQEYVIKSYVDKDFNIIDYKLLSIGLPYENIHDLRVFNFNNKNYLIGTNQYYDLINHYVYPVLVDENMNYLKLYINNIDNIKKIITKNWSPLIHNNKLFFIHNHNPLTIVEPNLETGKCNIIFKGKYKKNIPKLCGNTPYLNIGKNRYLALVHHYETISGRHYLHYFVMINFRNEKYPYIEKLSRSFCFEGNCGIEFAMGLTESHDNKSFIITYGKNDCSSKALIISKASVFSLFKKLN